MSKVYERHVKKERKRHLSPPLNTLLSLDVKLSKEVVTLANNFLPFRSLKVHNKLLEYSCHGIAWLAFWLGFTWLFNAPSWYQTQVNMLLGLVLDVIAVAVIKSITRRRRPSPSTDMMMLGPDKYSFPSGHASRSALVAYLFIVLDPLPSFCWPPLLAWVSAVCVSRLLMQRHHILDIVCGVLLGVFEGLVLGFLWIPKDTAIGFLSYLTDEKLEGGEYHI